MSPTRLLAASLLLAPALLALPQGAPKGAMRPVAESSARASSRILYFGGNSIGGEVIVDYAQPDWKDDYDAQIDSMLGVRWRLGKNFWTRLDSNMDLNSNGVEIPAGGYYLVLERRKEDQAFVLYALDPVEVRDAKLDAFSAKDTKGGIAIPMEHKAIETKADKLQIRLDVDASRKNGGNLVITFGKHQLTAKLTMSPAGG
jgi:hypothetical protein